MMENINQVHIRSYNVKLYSKGLGFTNAVSETQIICQVGSHM